jgi:hypothetical protein
MDMDTAVRAEQDLEDPLRMTTYHVLRHKFLSGNKDRVKQILTGTLAVFCLH